MSWSASIIIGPDGEGNIVQRSQTSSNIEQVPEHIHQFMEAMEAGIDLIASGVVGDPLKYDIQTTFSGHGNTDHEPAAGWANDFVSITITQLEKKE